MFFACVRKVFDKTKPHVRVFPYVCKVFAQVCI